MRLTSLLLVDFGTTSLVSVRSIPLSLGTVFLLEQYSE